MSYLHKNGFFHLNLKPENIVFDANELPKNTDFCLSRCFPQLFSQIFSEENKTVDNLIYTAPEMIENCENYRKSTDVYSFAMLAYQIVTDKKNVF